MAQLNDISILNRYLDKVGDSQHPRFDSDLEGTRNFLNVVQRWQDSAGSAGDYPNTLHSRGGLGISTILQTAMQIKDLKLRQDLLQQLDGNGSTKVTVKVTVGGEKFEKTFAKSPCFTGDMRLLASSFQADGTFKGQGIFAQLDADKYEIVKQPIAAAPVPSSPVFAALAEPRRLAAPGRPSC